MECNVGKHRTKTVIFYEEIPKSFDGKYAMISDAVVSELQHYSSFIRLYSNSNRLDMVKVYGQSLRYYQIALYEYV